jgi:hypothetical protein
MRHPGSVRAAYLAVTDIQAARRDLTARGVQVSDIRHKSPIDDWKGGFQPGADPARRDYASFADFADPDGNTWARRRQTRASGSARRTDRTTPTGTAAGCEAGAVRRVTAAPPAPRTGPALRWCSPP